MLFNKTVFNSLLAFSLVLSIGCASQNQPTQELTDLKKEIEALKSENQTLKNDSNLAVKEAQAELRLKETAFETTSPQFKYEFTDLDEELATTPLIQDLARLGVFKGLFKESNTEFNPYETITRAEYVTWLYKTHNAIATKASNKIQLAPAFDPGFTDLDKTHPAYKYVASLANAGYSVGYDDKTFKPDAPITREEMLVIKVGIDKGKAFRPDASQMAYVWKFSDSKAVDLRYTGYIHADYYVSNPNIQRCFGKIGTLRPKQPVLRHEAAASLWQFGDSANIRSTTAKHALSRKQNTAG